MCPLWDRPMDGEMSQPLPCAGSAPAAWAAPMLALGCRRTGRRVGARLLHDSISTGTEHPIILWIPQSSEGSQPSPSPDIMGVFPSALGGRGVDLRCTQEISFPTILSLPGQLRGARVGPGTAQSPTPAPSISPPEPGSLHTALPVRWRDRSFNLSPNPVTFLLKELFPFMSLLFKASFTNKSNFLLEL